MSYPAMSEKDCGGCWHVALDAVVEESFIQSISALGGGSCTGCSQTPTTTSSFPQLFPPLPIPPNCYSNLEWKTSMDFLKNKQNNLVLYRRRMGFTQKQVARLLGQRDLSMISHYEHGRALPPLAVALSLEII